MRSSTDIIEKNFHKKEWVDNMKNESIPKRKLQMMKDINNFYRMYDRYGIKEGMSQSQLLLELNESNNSNKENSIDIKGKGKDPYKTFGFLHQEGTSHALEMKIIEIIIRREAYLNELKSKSSYIITNNEIGERVSSLVLELLSQIRNYTIEYIEAVCLWRQDADNDPYSLVPKEKELRPFLWGNNNYTLRIVDDLNFITQNHLMMSKLNVTPEQIKFNPLMLTNNLYDPSTWIDPYERAVQDAKINKIPTTGTEFEKRLRLRFCERIILQEIETFTDATPEFDDNINNNNHGRNKNKSAENDKINLIKGSVLFNEEFSENISKGVLFILSYSIIIIITLK
jgi:hypothetical protein